jgi:hypothetical protein
MSLFRHRPAAPNLPDLGLKVPDYSDSGTAFSVILFGFLGTILASSMNLGTRMRAAGVADKRARVLTTNRALGVRR